MSKRVGVWVLMVAARCGGDVVTANSDPFSGPVTADNYSARFVAAECAREFACRGDEYTSTLRRIFRSEAECVQQGLAQENLQRLDDLVALARAASVRFDRDEAERCLREIARTCSSGPFPFNLPACARVFRGDVTSGGSCWRSEECLDSLWCSNDGGTPGLRTCPGTCQPRAALGESCAARPCSAAAATGEAWCHRLNGSRCIDLQTGLSATEGLPCGMRMLSPNLAIRTRCREGLRCETPEVDGISFTFDPENEGVCVRPVALGESCARGLFVCGDGTECLAETCQRSIIQVRPGDPCDSGSEGPRFCNPSLYLQCVAGVCQRIGNGALGSRCVKFCQRGLFCSEGACQPLGAAGAACRYGDECASGSCDVTPGIGEAGRCRARYCG